VTIGELKEARESMQQKWIGTYQGERSGWEIELYKHKEAGSSGKDALEDALEIDLEVEEEEISRKFLAIAVYYSRKSFGAKYLFAEMVNAWGIANMGQIEKLQFHKEEDKMKVMEGGGGAWRHKGDALIVVHYDGMTRPSEVCIDSIGMWVRLYDLPPIMMKEGVAKQLSVDLAEYIKMDSRFPGYMCVRALFPLKKALVPQLKVKIKGRGCMVIKVKYENVPYFCFTCGCLGHAVANCEEEVHDHEVKFSEDLRASPPKRSREIMFIPSCQGR
jgi:hypothetical protein